jgi:hypothetical protein
MMAIEAVLVGFYIGVGLNSAFSFSFFNLMNYLSCCYFFAKYSYKEYEIIIFRTDNSLVIYF